ncbi:MAG: UDP-N-acetylmuramoyl-L-alanyl-D-glutamate--2,6-diaminopimelate ligase [Prevotellaceae bacterium]|jgi:UDP-N-acetylmuramoyl-L-alanyl-D-glutamate--2,6-diaminopimelate ligase|nr:UDP-N-acetylmuramoyl-L-alanyl-D-glutamate--2,6-diaminopimelate ligase [Prevotellaceae bacterium]
MKLKELLSKTDLVEISGSADIDIAGLSFDSRNISENTLFFAISGAKADGHEFIESAIENGAKAVVCEKIPDIRNENVCYIKVKFSGDALGEIANIFYGEPSKQLHLVGVTGTNGKTTTATLLYRLFKDLGYKTGLLSTIAIYIDNRKMETANTTPDAITINSVLREMADCGCDYCFMEVSSHSLVQGRVTGLNFRGGIFSNITHDHLDYHKTFDEYIKAKKRFFDSLGKDAFALVNADDRNAKIMVQNTKAAVRTYALSSPADFSCRILEHSFEGMLLNIGGTETWVKFVGRFNASNLLAVYAAAILLGAEKDEVLTELSRMVPVSGRFESISLSSGVTAIVDYAHTPDALKNVLDAINDVRSSYGNLITVVGCGGNRDKTKRPEMALIGMENSDRLILTSDNPRFEKPEDIVDDMKAGLNTAQLSQTLCIVNRKEAIKTALTIARKGDIVLIAGKGHENYQEIEGVKYHFDDKEIVLEYDSGSKT